MSSLLFNLCMADMEEKLNSKEIGAVKIDRIRIYNLACANDLVLLAKNRETMQNMILSFKKFLKDRSLEINVGKSKMLVFNKRDRDRKKK